MTNLIVELSQYAFVLLIAMYTLLCFSILGRKQPKEIHYGWKFQNLLTFFIHLLGFVVLYLTTGELQVLIFYLCQLFLMQAILVFTRVLYPGVSRLVLNNMCLLLDIGFIILTRLSFDKAVRQFQIAALASIFALLVPLLIRKCSFLKKLPWLYAFIGVTLLLLVAVTGETTSGAKLTLSIGNITLQPSEFVKISFVFFAAASLSKDTGMKNLFWTTLLAAVHVVILVASRDLGGALLFFVTYLVMLYAATGKRRYFLAGLCAGCGAAFIGYQLFSHVRVRVLAWSDPFQYIDKEGYQITQSLFAIGTGHWFGMGLFQGIPGKIPVVEQDFVFSAIAEEFGGIFAICLILICMNCFMMFMNIAMQIKESFYKYTALGLGTLYGFQVFLTIGGAIKFIPSTGVTLPLISYGGSSLAATLLMFAIIQGIYLLKEDEELAIEEKREQDKARRKKTKRKKAEKS